MPWVSGSSAGSTRPGKRRVSIPSTPSGARRPTMVRGASGSRAGRRPRHGVDTPGATRIERVMQSTGACRTARPWQVRATRTADLTPLRPLTGLGPRWCAWGAARPGATWRGRSRHRTCWCPCIDIVNVSVIWAQRGRSVLACARRRLRASPIGPGPRALRRRGCQDARRRDGDGSSSPASSC
jgi:hypothetical protein